MTGREADALARELLAARGFGDAFGHSLGHGLGLEVHEAPRLCATAEAVAAGGRGGDDRAGASIFPGGVGCAWRTTSSLTADGAARAVGRTDRAGRAGLTAGWGPRRRRTHVNADEMKQLAQLLQKMPGIKSIELKDVKRLVELLRESPGDRRRSRSRASSAPGWSSRAPTMAPPRPPTGAR